MKFRKLLGVLFLSTLFLLSTGCSKTDDENQKITGEVSKALLDSKGDIVIKKKDVTDEVRYYNYEYDGIQISILAVRDSRNKVQVVMNTCQSCGGSPKAYFVQIGKRIRCQNCRSFFDIDKLDELEEDGCNPLAIEDKVDEGEKITISHQELEKYKDKFDNWQGPMV